MWIDILGKVTIFGKYDLVLLCIGNLSPGKGWPGNIGYIVILGWG